LVVAVGVSDLEDDDVLICNLFAERIWSSLCLASDVGISVGAGAELSVAPIPPPPSLPSQNRIYNSHL